MRMRKTKVLMMAMMMTLLRPDDIAAVDVEVGFQAATALVAPRVLNEDLDGP